MEKLSFPPLILHKLHIDKLSSEKVLAKFPLNNYLSQTSKSSLKAEYQKLQLIPRIRALHLNVNLALKVLHFS